MPNYYAKIENVKGLPELKVNFDFEHSNIAVITGRNGAGKTTLVKAFKLIADPQVFEKTSSLNSIGLKSRIHFELNKYSPLTYSYNPKLKVLDTKQALPPKNTISSELPIPFGDRFRHFSLVAKHDSDIRVNIASSNYKEANDLCEFFNHIYPGNTRFSNLKETLVKRDKFYFILQPSDYYIREDHFSSGEFFLIQLYRLITSGAELIIIDEIDISLDASAQVHFISAVLPLLNKYHSKLIVISHSLALMETAPNDILYFLEEENGKSSLEQRSFGYIKSGLYGFKGRDRYIITEDPVLVGFIEYLIKIYNIDAFFQYEIIAVGGQPQIDSITKNNDEHEIFAPSSNVIVVIDKDIENRIKYTGITKVCISPVDDIELFIWENRAKLLSDVKIREFQPAIKDKQTAKTYWSKVIASKKKTRNDLYKLVIDEHKDGIIPLVNALKTHLCLSDLDESCVIGE